MKTHYHPETWKHLGVHLPEGVLLLETGLENFSQADNEQLGFPFQAIEAIGDETTTARHLIIDLPFQEMVHGVGKGYANDLLGYAAEATGLGHTTLIKLDFPTWGSPVEGSRLVAILSADPLPTAPASPRPRCAVLSDVLPRVAAHPLTLTRRNVLNPGFHTVFGYVNSTAHPLPEVGTWGGKPPMAEVIDGTTLKVTRLSVADLTTLWGIEVTKGDLTPLLRSSPALALANLISVLP